LVVGTDPTNGSTHISFDTAEVRGNDKYLTERKNRRRFLIFRYDHRHDKNMHKLVKTTVMELIGGTIKLIVNLDGTVYGSGSKSCTNRGEVFTQYQNDIPVDMATGKPVISSKVIVPPTAMKLKWNGSKWVAEYWRHFTYFDQKTVNDNTTLSMNVSEASTGKLVDLIITRHSEIIERHVKAVKVGEFGPPHRGWKKGKEPIVKTWIAEHYTDETIVKRMPDGGIIEEFSRTLGGVDTQLASLTEIMHQRKYHLDPSLSIVSDPKVSGTFSQLLDKIVVHLIRNQEGLLLHDIEGRSVEIHQRNSAQIVGYLV